MPAGDLVVADWQAELRATLMGVTTTYELKPGISGLGRPRAKTNDLEFVDADGSYGGRDHRGIRVVSLPLEIATGDAASALNGLDVMNDVWDTTATTDIPLYLRLPGWGKFFVNGRPRGLTEDLDLVEHGLISCLAIFETTLDSTLHFV